jgi:hypothetical protein
MNILFKIVYMSSIFFLISLSVFRNKLKKKKINFSSIIISILILFFIISIEEVNSEQVEEKPILITDLFRVDINELRFQLLDSFRVDTSVLVLNTFDSSPEKLDSVYHNNHPDTSNFRPTATENIQIMSPSRGALVSPKTFVEGKINYITAEEVWVIVHPIGISSFWVQPLISVRQNGNWKVLAYFGRDNVDSGVHYEIMSVANPDSKLIQGQILNSWPGAQWYSEIIEVIRK